MTLAPSNPEIVWVGTGGADNARSTYYGDGVYKSTDGGKTWKNMGLEESHHIACKDSLKEDDQSILTLIPLCVSASLPAYALWASARSRSSSAQNRA